MGFAGLFWEVFCVKIEFAENRANGYLHPAAAFFTSAQEESGGGVHLRCSLDLSSQDSAYD